MTVIARLVADTEARLFEAALTLRRLRVRGCRPAGHRALWPDMVRNWWESYNPEARTRCPPALPTPAEISRMDEVWSWLFWVEAPARSLLMGRALGVRWRWLAQRSGMSMRTARRRHRDALIDLAAARVARAKNPVAHLAGLVL